MEWQLQDAKNRFSEVVKRAASEGPQVVTVRGERAVVIVSAAEFDLMAKRAPTLVEFLLTAPRLPDDIEEEILRRPIDPDRPGSL
jgi:prevent-host-death family protein